MPADGQRGSPGLAAFDGGINAFGTASALAVIMFIAIFGVSMTARWWFGRLEEGLA